MKHCPVCRETFDDQRSRFCPFDQTVLVENAVDSSTPSLDKPVGEITVLTKDMLTGTTPANPVASITPEKGRKWLPWVVGGALLGVISISVVVGFLVIRSRYRLPVHLSLQVSKTELSQDVAVRKTIEIIKRRLIELGIARFRIEPDGDPSEGKIKIDLPHIDNPERVISILTTGGTLEFARVESSPFPNLRTYDSRDSAISSFNNNGTIPSDRRALSYREEATQNATQKWVVLDLPSIIDGTELKDATPVPEASGQYSIQFTLTKAGGDRLGQWTGAHVNDYMAVVLNGEVKSIAFIRSQIFESGRIDGRFTRQTASDLALVLRAGSLPATVTITSQKFDG